MRRSFDNALAPSVPRTTGKRLAGHSALAACAVLAFVGWRVVDDYGLSNDAETQRTLAASTLAYVQGRPNRLLDPTYRDQFYGPAFELALLAGERVLGLQDSRRIHRLRHGLTHLFFLAGGWGCAWLTYRRYGSRRLALCALGLFLLHPRLYAHSFFNSKDLPFLALFMLTLCLAQRAFRRDTLAAFALCGAGAGLLINLRLLGALLFVAVLGLRACDAVCAADGPARRHVLRTSVLFAAAGALALYATWPYLWADPVRRLGAAFAYMAQHPMDISNVFRGRYVSSLAVPPDYIPVWFAVTAPPGALLLGLLGALAWLRRVGGRPRALVRNTALRFEGLLVACVFLPALAVILLESTLYNDWRQMYFLHAPFCLLAVAGLRALATACAPYGRRVYGWAGLGLGTTAAAMLGLHPHQYAYFNFLTARAQPEGLAAQYTLDYWDIELKEALDALRVRYAGPWRVTGSSPRALQRTLALLPAADRRRITAVDALPADFYIQQAPGARAQAAYAPLLTRRVYNTTLFVVTALNLAYADPAAAAAARRAHRAATAQPPAARGRFDLHLDGQRLTYRQAPCRWDDAHTRFLLHVVPVDPRALPAHARTAGFENLDFEFHRRGVYWEDACWATVALPAYALQYLHTGQRLRETGELLWAASLPAPLGPDARAAYRAAYAALAAQAPARRSVFDVYVTAGTVTFAKAPCAAADTEPEFFLRVAADPQALPDRAFDALDFPFFARGVRWEDRCLASVPRPAYPVRALQVGQRQPGAARPRWQADLFVAPAAAPPEYRAAYRTLTARPPAHRAAFDVYVGAARVTFAKTPCAAADTEPQFFLHAEPADPRPLAGRPFANLDFPFVARGVRFADRCLASVPLPAYPLEALRVGQFRTGEDPLWRADLALPRAPRRTQAYRQAWRARATALPAYRGVFDVHVAADVVAFAQAPCAAADTEPTFMLHVVPVRPRDLPPDRRSAGFDNRDFRFAWQGAHFDGRCLARAPLPAWPIASLRVGQFRSGEEPLWRAEIPRPR